VAEYCDGWIPGHIGIDLAGGVEAIKAEAAKQGRAFDRLDLTVMTAEEMARGRLEVRINELVKIGFKRISFLMPTRSAGSPANCIGSSRDADPQICLRYLPMDIGILIVATERAGAIDTIARK
jgi:alkanesulfonate monooxygenase SsuD/methylene tetrahydromethanopterin reductase-like flavin-dependent oxidoreductase (luciferase family)